MKNSFPWVDYLAHARCGLHSNIPKCCIKFYIENYLISEIWPDRIRKIDKYWAKFPHMTAEYSPCDSCVKNNTEPNELLACNPSGSGCAVYRREGILLPFPWSKLGISRKSIPYYLNQRFHDHHRTFTEMEELGIVESYENNR